MAGRKRKIRFVEPGSRPGRPFNAWIGRWPLLGPIVLATILDRDGYDARVYNENASGPLDKNAPAIADISTADVVGISIMTATANRGYELAGLIRSLAPQATVVIGGVHATFMSEEAARYGDVVVVGEAENVIGQIASGEISTGIVRPDPPADLNEVPALNHELLFDFDRLIAEAGGQRMYELPMMASRGCPHGCVYCCVTRMFGRQVRRQSPQKVESDLRQYRKRGFRHVFFYDDNLASDRPWIKDLLGRMEPLRLRWNAQVRVDMHWADRGREERDDELLSAMRRSGARVLYIGYDAIDEPTARRWGKGYRGSQSLSQRLHEDTRILHRHGFWIHGMFMLGPEHDKKNIDGIVKFAREAQIESIQLSVLTPIPGTPLFEQMREDLIFTDFPADWDYYDGTHCVYRHGRMGIAALQKSLLDAHRRFYHSLRPSLHRLAKLVRQNMRLRDKLGLICRHARMARPVFKQWKQETLLYLERVRSKGSAYLLPRPGNTNATGAVS